MDKYVRGLELIQECLEKDLMIETYVNVLGTHLYSIRDSVSVVVVSPHEGTKGKWLIRMSPSASFDRWANSGKIEEEFDTADELCRFLHCNALFIYQRLFENISADYRELQDEMEEEEGE